MSVGYINHLPPSPTVQLVSKIRTGISTQVNNGRSKHSFLNVSQHLIHHHLFLTTPTPFVTFDLLTDLFLPHYDRRKIDYQMTLQLQILVLQRIFPFNKCRARMYCDASPWQRSKSQDRCPVVTLPSLVDRAADRHLIPPPRSEHDVSGNIPCPLSSPLF